MSAEGDDDGGVIKVERAGGIEKIHKLAES